MSNNNLFLPAGFPRVPLANGVGRWVCQLQRLTFKFCKSLACSRGMREYLEFDLVDFAKKNPGVVVYVKPRRHRAPNLTAEYLNGEKQIVSTTNFTHDEVKKWVTLMYTQSGREDMRFRKLWRTNHPSIQGPWNPFVNKHPELNIAQFPNEELSKPIFIEKTATEKLLEIFEEQKKVLQEKQE